MFALSLFIAIIDEKCIRILLRYWVLGILWLYHDEREQLYLIIIELAARFFTYSLLEQGANWKIKTEE